MLVPMFYYPKTVILRHRKENLKKCSLRGLENRKDILFYTYPKPKLPPLSNYVILSFDGPMLSKEDHDKGLFFIDATWRYAKVMYENTPVALNLEKRSLPQSIITAYPRKQGDCPEPDRGLATVEALYTAYRMLGRDCSALLDHYYWKEAFISKNQHK